MQYHQTNLALGSEIALSIVLDGNDDQAAAEIFQELWQTIFGFERQFSRFLPSSELSLFNRNAGLRQHISPEFKDILAAAKKISQETGGLYNPFILPALQAAGYDHSLVPGYEDDPQDDHSHKHVVGADRLRLGEDWATIPYGTALDLGGCGKGYLADRLADIVEKKVAGYWLSLGGDIITGGVDADGQNWQVAVQNASGSGEQDIALVHCPVGRLAIATSGVTQRRGVKRTKTWHHLIDPTTLAPARTDIRLATVCATSGLQADVLASCAVIVGSRRAVPFLKSHGAAAALLQGVKPGGESFQKQYGKVIYLD